MSLRDCGNNAIPSSHMMENIKGRSSYTYSHNNELYVIRNGYTPETAEVGKKQDHYRTDYRTINIRYPGNHIEHGSKRHRL